MSNEIIDVKTDEEKLSTAGEILSMNGGLDPEQLEKIAEQRVDFFRKVSMLSLRRTSVHDWTDQGGKPYLQATGAEKLMGLWGIWTRDVKITVEMDLGTGYPCYEVTGRVGSRTLGTEMDVIGGRNSNDLFFQKQVSSGMKLDLLDVKKAAYSNWIVNAVTRLIGMRGLKWEEIEEVTGGKITKGKATGQVAYKKHGEAAKEPEKAQEPPASASNGQSKASSDPNEVKTVQCIVEAVEVVERDGKKPFASFKVKGSPIPFTTFDTEQFENAKLLRGKTVCFDYTEKSVGDKIYRNVKEFWLGKEA